MSALVIKEWKAGQGPVDKAGHYVLIRGRKGGLIDWLLALAKVDPVTTVKVDAQRVEFSQASLSGTVYRMIPLEGICSTFYGYHKPWIQALASFFVLWWLLTVLATVVASTVFRSGGLAIVGGLAAFVVALGAAIVQYVLGRSLTLGFVEMSGAVSSIQFKRSVIENVNVDESQARYICEITQYLIETRRQAASRG